MLHNPGGVRSGCAQALEGLLSALWLVGQIALQGKHGDEGAIGLREHHHRNTQVSVKASMVLLCGPFAKLGGSQRKANKPQNGSDNDTNQLASVNTAHHSRLLLGFCLPNTFPACAKRSWLNLGCCFPNTFSACAKSSWLNPRYRLEL